MAPITNNIRVVPGLLEKINPSQVSKTDDSNSSGGGFAAQLGKVLDSVNDIQAESAQNAFMKGEPVELHQVMIKAQEAGLAMDLLLEVRNKLVTAYNEIARMPM